MIFKRKESKSYGTKSLIEGHYKSNDNCLLIEDVVTYGDSIIETTKVHNYTNNNKNKNTKIKKYENILNSACESATWLLLTQLSF